MGNDEAPPSDQFRSGSARAKRFIVSSNPCLSRYGTERRRPVKTTLFVLVLAAVPALAQEPSAPIKSAETVTVAASHPCTSVAVGDSKPAPVIYPEPRPTKISLGEYARRIRAAHGYAPKAATYKVNDDAPIEEVAYKEFR